MKLIARSDGPSCRQVSAKTRATRHGGIPRQSAETTAPSQTAVPGSEIRLRSATAGSGVGVGVTGGTRKTTPWRPGTFRSSALKFRYAFTEGNSHTRLFPEGNLHTK